MEHNARAVEVEASAAPLTVTEVKYGEPLPSSQNPILAWRDGHSIGYEAGLRKAIELVLLTDHPQQALSVLRDELAKGALQDAEANAGK